MIGIFNFSLESFIVLDRGGCIIQEQIITSKSYCPGSQEEGKKGKKKKGKGRGGEEDLDALLAEFGVDTEAATGMAILIPQVSFLTANYSGCTVNATHPAICTTDGQTRVECFLCKIKRLSGLTAKAHVFVSSQADQSKVLRPSYNCFVNIKSCSTVLSVLATCNFSHSLADVRQTFVHIRCLGETAQVLLLIFASA